ncbi:MAG: hypothetical protein WBC90_16645 [Albidovulum sp.]
MALQQSSSPRGAVHEGHDPLEYWLEQERSSAFVGPLGGHADDQQTRVEGRMASGWWLLPVMVMALPVWGLIIWLIVRA